MTDDLDPTDLELRTWARALFGTNPADAESDDDAPKPVRDLLISNEPPRRGLFA